MFQKSKHPKNILLKSQEYTDSIWKRKPFPISFSPSPIQRVGRSNCRLWALSIHHSCLQIRGVRSRFRVLTSPNSCHKCDRVTRDQREHLFNRPHVTATSFSFQGLYIKRGWRITYLSRLPGKQFIWIFDVFHSGRRNSL